MTHSMTAYANRTGHLDAVTWQWEMRSVNARGLDVRVRVPDGLDGLEAHIRTALKAELTRGNVTVNLRLSRNDSAETLQVDEAQLDRVLTALDQVQDRAFTLGVTLGQPTAADVLAQRGVIVAKRAEDDNAPLVKALIADTAALFDDFQTMRAQEGASLLGLLTAQVDEMEDLIRQSQAAAIARRPAVEASVRDAMARVSVEADAGRLEQELALLAMKQDVTEELDRLTAHIAAARALLSDPKPMGRKLDFLSQEFNREANTLCSKSQNTELTAVGLALKAVIEQMREQVQNVE